MEPKECPDMVEEVISDICVFFMTGGMWDSFPMFIHIVF